MSMGENLVLEAIYKTRAESVFSELSVLDNRCQGCHFLFPKSTTFEKWKINFAGIFNHLKPLPNNNNFKHKEKGFFFLLNNVHVAAVITLGSTTKYHRRNKYIIYENKTSSISCVILIFHCFDRLTSSLMTCINSILHPFWPALMHDSLFIQNTLKGSFKEKSKRSFRNNVMKNSQWKSLKNVYIFLMLRADFP